MTGLSAPAQKLRYVQNVCWSIVLFLLCYNKNLTAYLSLPRGFIYVKKLCFGVLFFTYLEYVDVTSQKRCDLRKFQQHDFY